MVLFFISSVNEEFIKQTVWSKVQKEKVGDKYKDNIYNYTNTKYNCTLLKEKISTHTHARRSNFKKINVARV